MPEKPTEREKAFHDFFLWLETANPSQLRGYGIETFNLISTRRELAHVAAAAAWNAALAWTAKQIGENRT
jgi:hypothetical protein